MNQRTPIPSPPDSRPALAPSASAEAPPFETAIKRLTEIVQMLERGELPLEESLRLFEEGIKLSRASQQRLDAAEKRVEQLLAVDEQGQVRTSPFATESNGEDESSRL